MTDMPLLIQLAAVAMMAVFLGLIIWRLPKDD